MEDREKMTSWSYSAFSTAVQCLQKFQLCYVDQVAPDYESGDMAFGSALHSAINAILQGEDGAQVFNIYWRSYEGKEHVSYGRYNWVQLLELGEVFASKFARLHAKHYQLERAEVRLYSEYRGVQLEGTFDFYGQHYGKRSLRDFKTSAYNYAKERGDMALQLYLYTFLARSNGMAAPETLGYTVFNKSLGSIQDLTWDFSEKKMIEALDGLVDYCTLLGNTAKYPKNLNNCMIGTNRCQYYSRCHTKEVV
jgi:hypothetical protein